MTESELLAHLRDVAASESRPPRLGVMGGTFDPVHVAHVAMAEASFEQLGLDGLLFLPAGNPAFKQGMVGTPAADRLRMVELAVGGRQGWAASAREVEREGVTYTVDTLEDLRRDCPPTCRLLFIVGGDALETLPFWRRSDRIAELCEVAAFERRGCDAFERSVARAEGAGFTVHRLVADLPAVSSTQVRDRLTRGLGVEGLLDPEVARYIEGHGLYRERGAAASWREAETERLKRAVCERLTGHRLQHVLGVADTCLALAHRYGVDPFEAQAAGLLHDWDKQLPAEELWAKARALGIVPEDSDEDLFPLLHAWTAAASLPSEFPELPEAVFRAIERHTVGARDMSPLDMVVFSADLIEPGRAMPGVDDLRALVGEVSLERLFAACFAHGIEHLVSSRRYIYPGAVDVWNAYRTCLPRG